MAKITVTAKPKIDTLISDIYQLLSGEKEGYTKVNEDNLRLLLTGIENVVRKKLEKEKDTPDKKYLRISNLGTKNRKLWYTLKLQDVSPQSELAVSQEPLDPILELRFFYGDLLEEILLFFAREAGHDVTDTQKEVNINGVVGHQDCTIDGITVDVKTASAWGFKKFSQGTLFKDDPFGYIAQISGYASQSENPDKAAFLAINKETGELALLKIDSIDMIDPEKRIEEVREFLDKSTPPEEKCYEPVQQGASGNLVLATGCTYCPFKELCWKDTANNGKGLRAFQYANKVEYFTHIEKLPRVPEITSELENR